MVAYTTSAKSSEGFSSDSEVEAYVQNAISESNLCFLNSKVNAAIRLVHLVEVDYTETQDRLPIWIDRPIRRMAIWINCIPFGINMVPTWSHCWFPKGTERWVESPIPCPIHPLILKIVDLMLWSWIRLGSEL